MSQTDNAPEWLDRVGIFKLKPFDWRVERGKNGAQTVFVVVNLLVVAQLDGKEWVSWENSDPYQTRARVCIVKLDGTINQTGVDQLSKSLGWDGDLRTVVGQLPPDVVVQGNVKASTSGDRTFYNVEWLNPGDYVPQRRGEDANGIGDLTLRFGSLLRAAAAPTPGAAKLPAPRPRPAADEPDDDVPF